jgi:DNA-binding transcriptional LysR family regulator
VLSAEAPKIRLEMIPIGPGGIAPQLADGVVDIAFDQSARPMPEWVDSVVVQHARPVVIAARGNRALRLTGCRAGDRLSLDLFCAVPHVSFSPGGEFVPLEDVLLAAAGRRRNVVMTLPSFLSIAHLVARSELIGMIPSSMAERVAEPLGIDIYISPVTAAPVPLSFFWHARNTHDTAHAWMRQQMIKVLGLG